MYFPFFKLHSWGKRSAVRRRRFIQRLLKLIGKWAQKYRSKAALVMAGPVRSLHIESSLKTAHKTREVHAPNFIRAHIQLAGLNLTNDHTFKSPYPARSGRHLLKLV